MKFLYLFLSFVKSDCPDGITWQKTGESGLLKWAQSAESGYLNAKLTIKQRQGFDRKLTWLLRLWNLVKSSLPIADIQEMLDTREHVPFTVGVLFQRCLPDIQILSEFKQIRWEKKTVNRLVKFSAVTKNCGERKNELTLVTLQSRTFIGPKGQKNSLLLKKAEVGSILSMSTVQSFFCSGFVPIFGSIYLTFSTSAGEWLQCNDNWFARAWRLWHKMYPLQAQELHISL